MKRPGFLMLVAGILFAAGATLVATPMTAPSYVLSALAIFFLVLGTMSLLRARRLK